ncbi:uncharacterized protein LOC113135065 [Mastacembelus armatus]|uniref:uncharacterized protein LOC113135065 n=1 Tax=Mastacembelus armatus TaxID=205130 RepID=UPI000E4545EF|nr:uncharacterized protein LOC113135065 [Mastacembelus armatus]
MGHQPEKMGPELYFSNGLKVSAPFRLCHLRNNNLSAVFLFVFYQLLFVTLPVCPLSDLSESILQSMQKSRRLLFILSPDFLTEKSFSLLECRLGLYLHCGHWASIVAVVYRSVSKLPSAEVVQLRQASVSTVTWRGSRSEPRRSRFWLRLRLALPLRPLALGRRLIDSTSSHSDLAALALQRAQHIQNQNHRDRANKSHRNRWMSANQGYRYQQAAPRWGHRMRIGGSCREEGSQHTRNHSGCTGSVGQVEDRRVELRVQMSHDRTEVQSDPVPQTDHTLTPDSPHNTHSTPDPAPVRDPASELDSALSTCD